MLRSGRPLSASTQSAKSRPTESQHQAADHASRRGIFPTGGRAVFSRRASHGRARTFRIPARRRGPFSGRSVCVDKRDGGNSRSTRRCVRKNPGANRCAPDALGAKQHDYAVGLASHLPQLAAVAMASFLYNHLDENGLPITLAGPDCAIRCGLRHAHMPRSDDIVLHESRSAFRRARSVCPTPRVISRAPWLARTGS